MIKIKVFGYRGAINSTERIEKELLHRGYNLVNNPEDDPDWLLDLNGLFDKTEEFYAKCKKKPIRLYNLLDVNNENYDIYISTIKHLNDCEIACTISETTKFQIIKKLDLKKDIEVIGFPMRDVNLMEKPLYRTLDFLWVGRLYSNNKRFHLVKETLKYLGIQNINTKLIVVGTENPPFGYYAGISSDEDLEIIYNSTMFCFLTSKSEGLGLSSTESVVCGCFPVVCNDNPVIKELGLQDFAADPDGKSLGNKIIEINENTEQYRSKLQDLRKIYLEKYTVKAVVDKIISLYNAY